MKYRYRIKRKIDNTFFCHIEEGKGFKWAEKVEYGIYPSEAMVFKSAKKARFVCELLGLSVECFECLYEIVNEEIYNNY